jgi:lysophospholipase L1-like esterase
MIRAFKNLFILFTIFFKVVASCPAQKILVSEPVRFLALGDSYTIGQSVPSAESWPLQFVEELKESGYRVDGSKIIAQTGWRTDNLMAAIEREMPLDGYNLISLLIGVNNQFQGGNISVYSKDFEELLKTCINLVSGEKERIFILSIPDYAYTPFGGMNPAISRGIDEFNTVNKEMASRYRVAYINITGISREGLRYPDLVAIDGLHPSGKMYALWVSEIMNNIGIGTSSDAKRSLDWEINILPAQEQIYLRGSGVPCNRFLMLNAMGQVVVDEFFAPTNEIRIPLIKPAQGVYLLKLAGYGRTLATFKVMI